MRRLIIVSAIAGVLLVCVVVGRAIAEKPRTIPQAGPTPGITATRVNPPAERCDLSAEEQLMVSELRTRLGQLEQRRLTVIAQEAALNTLKAQVAEQLDELRAIQRAIANDMDAAEQSVASDREARIVQLAGIIKKMKPNQAAPIIARQNLSVAVAVLDSIGARQAGKVLAVLPPEHAVRIAERLVAMPMKKTPPKTGGKR